MDARPRPDLGDVAVASAAVAPEIGDALARAFVDDPVWSWIAPDERRRPAVLERTFRAFAAHLWLPHETVWTTDRLDAAACWEAPGHTTVPPGTQARLLPTVLGTGPRPATRMLRIDRALQAARPREPHWYLALIGVAPEARGRGWGGQLLRAALARVDAQHTVAYLEASSENSRRLYLRHGFEDHGPPITIGDSPPLFPMLRPAAR
jgi:GNAT superfamily N-acetyltransferase